METFKSVLFCVILTILQLVDCFNIEDRDPVMKRGEINTYFGYSVALHKAFVDGEQKNWILVGAPLADNLQPNTSRSGGLYRCDIPEPGTIYDNYCQQVPTDGRRSEEDVGDFDYDGGLSPSSSNDNIPLPPGNDEIKDGQWLGVNVRSQGPGGMVMVCAHRYITSSLAQMSDLSQHRFSPGLCYAFKSDLKFDYAYEPCKGRSVKGEHQEYGYCQVGTSLALLNDGTALMGSPGPFTWRGTIFAIEVGGEYIDRDKTVYIGPLSETPEPIDKYSYVGMSVAAGRFFESNQTFFASGAPRTDLHGAVYIFKRSRNVQVMDIYKIIRGEQFGSSFGYEILVTDINKDGFDDLIVGAPFYFNNTEGGAVYVYYNLRKCLKTSCKYDLKLTGPAESRFGFSMTALGDINRDGYTDIAIGAPYEGIGAIYIYLGSADGLITPASQKIQPKAEFLSTFGYSLNGGLDMDGNGYPDLVTGAYESDKIFLFRTRQIVDIKVEVVGDELKNINPSKKGCNADPYNTNNTCFSFETCFQITSEDVDVDGVICEIEETYEKIKYSRVWFREEGLPFARHTRVNVSVPIQRGIKKYCQEHTVYIREGTRDILSPLTFKVNYVLSNYSVHTPILNKTSVEHFVATFQKDCGNDDLCQSNLILVGEVTEEFNLTDYGVPLSVSFTIINTKEPAYEANLYIVHPLALSYVGADKETNKLYSCKPENDTLVVCNVGNPLRGDEDAAFIKINFEIDQKAAKDNKLVFYAFVNSTSEELSTKTNVTLTSTIKKIADVQILSGATSQVVYGGDIKGESGMRFLEDIGERIVHTYQVLNNGPWHVEGLTVTIDWPLQVASYTAQGKWLLYLEGIPEFENKEDRNYCIVKNSEAVNPLNLTSITDFAESSVSENVTVSQAHSARKRRDTEYIIKPDTVVSTEDNKERQVVVMDCARGSAKCVQIVCTITKLPKGGEETIKVKSRIWNSTLVEDYSNVDWVEIYSRAHITIPDLTITQTTTSDDAATALTKAYPVVQQGAGGVSIWIIIGAVLAGLLLLVILVVVLWRLGFFKRNRISDPTLSGNLTKQGESESLLNKPS